MKDLAKRVEELEALLAVALARIEELEAQLQQTSRNSSKPPSSDMSRRKVPKAATDRKPGGQPGHAGTTQEIVSPEHVDEVVDQDPETCANCGAPLEMAPRRWKPCEQLANARSQIYHAHLRRHFQAMLERGGAQGAMLKLASDRAFRYSHSFERDKINRVERIRRMAPIQKAIRQHLMTLRDHPHVQR
jgi:hypothetical protein